MTKRKVSLIGGRRAGPHHVVLSFATSGAAPLYRRQPCAECPWRQDRPTGVFPADAFRHSVSTCRDAAMSTFACHMSGTIAPATCAGFLRSKDALHNILVRIRLASGNFKLEKVRSTVPLYPTYRAMAVANGVAPDDPALIPLRTDF